MQEPTNPREDSGFSSLGSALQAQPDIALIGLNGRREISHWPLAAERILGWSSRDVNGRRVEVLFAEDQRPELWRQVGIAGANEIPALGEWAVDLLSRDGRPVPCGVRFLGESEGPTLFVRERKSDAFVEARLRASGSLLSLAGAATILLDPGGKIRELGSDWPVPQSGESTRWVGRHVADLFSGDRRDVVKALREAVRVGHWLGQLPIGGRATSLTLRAVHDGAGNLEAIAGACAHGRNGLETLMQCAPFPLLLLDGALRIRSASEKATALCAGEGAQGLEGVDVRSLNIFQVRPIQEALEGMLEQGVMERPSVQLATVRAQPLDAALHGCPVLDAQGKRDGYLLAVLPRATDGDLEKQLLRAHKMESIGNFASGLAHDFGNFVAVILGKTGMLRVKLPEDPHVTRDLDDIETAAKRAQHLSQELMRFARGGRSRVARLDVNSLIDAVGSLIQTSVGKRITLDIRLAQGLPSVDGDEVELQQLVLNLCLNARDAMPNGGRLTIETRVLTEEQRTRLSVGGDPVDGVCMVVRDTGMGMPPDVLERIFEPFFTTKSDSSKGAGLGLAMVYGIVRRHGGTIDVKSRLSVGTAFEILIPASGPKKEEQTRGVTLVVDDEPAFGEMIRLILEEDGHTVKLASNGIEALRTIQEEHANLTLIILDLRMPGVDGLGVLDELREIAPELPVLVTTGYAGAEERQEALRRGARKVLEKPYRVAELRAALEEVLAGPPPKGPVAGPANEPTPNAPAPQAIRQPSGELWFSGGSPR